MEEARRLRTARIAVSATCIFLLVICSSLWVSSYFMVLLLGRDVGLREVAVASLPGELNLLVHTRSRKAISQWEFGTERITRDWKHPLQDLSEPSLIRGFRWITGRNPVQVSVPYWFTIVLVTMCAAAPWAPWSRRFSLRSLLIGMTAVAVVLGLATAFR